jgi:hypothetical protein
LWSLKESGDTDMPTFVGNAAGTVAQLMPDGTFRPLKQVEYQTIYGEPVPIMLSDAEWAELGQYVPPLTSVPPVVVPPANVDTKAIADAVVAQIPPYPTHVAVAFGGTGTLG